MKNNLSKQTFVVTGATSGIGLAVTEALAAQGATILGVGRSKTACRAAEQHLFSLHPHAQVHYLRADLSIQDEVRHLSDQIASWLQQHNIPALNGLLNNAGTFACWLTLTPDGIELQWAVNHLAPFLLTRCLLPLLQAAPKARIVTVSSASHHQAHLNWADPQMRRNYNGLLAYGNTKLANLLFTLQLNQYLKNSPWVRAFAADPGLVKTEIGFKNTPPLVNWIWKIRRRAGISAADSARGIVFLLSEPDIQQHPAMYWKHGCPERPGRAALDLGTARRLWTLSETMCGLNQGEYHVSIC